MTELEVDLTTFGGIAAATTFLVGLGKSQLPRLFEGREKLFALAIALILTLTSRFSGIGFQSIQWPLLIMSGIAAGIGGGLIHDKVTNPVRGKE